MDRYENFWSVTEAALRSASRQLRISIDDAGVDRLMRAYLFPAAFEDVKPALQALKGVPLVILSNSSLKMLESAVRHNGLESFLPNLYRSTAHESANLLRVRTLWAPKVGGLRHQRSYLCHRTPGMDQVPKRKGMSSVGAIGKT